MKIFAGQETLSAFDQKLIICGGGYKAHCDAKKSVIYFCYDTRRLESSEKTLSGSQKRRSDPISKRETQKRLLANIKAPL